MNNLESLGSAKENKEEIIAVQEKIDVLNGELKRKNLEFSVIQILSNEIITSLDLDRIFQVAMQSLDEYFGFSHSLILLNDSEKSILTVSASHGYCGQGIGATVPIGQGVIGVVAKRRKLMRSSGMGYRKVYVQSVQKNMNLDQVSIPLPGLQNVGSQLAIPLVVKDNLIGVYAIESEEFNAFDSIDEQILMIVGNQIGSAISNARAYREIEDLKNNLEEKVHDRTKKLEEQTKETEKQKQEIQALNRLVKSLNEDINLDSIMEKVFRFLNQRYKIQYFSILGISEDGKSLDTLASKLPEFISPYTSNKIASMKYPITLEHGAQRHVLHLRKPFLIKNAENKKWRKFLTKEEIYIIENSQIFNVLFVPLIVNNTNVGVLNLSNSEDKMNLSQSDIDQISILGENLAGIVMNSKLFSEVEQEKAKADHLLLNILPHSIATELKETNQVKPQYITSSSVIFTDFVGFTEISEKLSPEDLIKELDGCFSQFDEISKRNNLEKLKTIGDAYMCAGGLPISNQTHPIDACLAALEFRSFMNQMGDIKKALGLPFWELRIGIHTGPVTAGVIGTNKFTYDIWGDTVNTASRMESSGEPGKVNISGTTFNLVKNLFLCDHRGKIQAKGKGEVDMYFLERIKSEFSADKDGLVPNEEFFQAIKQL
ncbi:adenylate/guanylate cyclase domain-containing protein [Leptospira sp. GIMC2001]|uniref:adenylate/guanylate cyclase domain-containing protein n=1 Tax=Leptospira sp. GIMC2001 TaxID=1513297 RepID=UPI00234A858E|nr:adenylate/guanylate cyclase domain-containing protein [Leptospira sp. GIMC2001]WCL47782.1 GAF domain-containing protein [Leptospira sp. GIMC2001]